MNTPAHLALGLAVLGRRATRPEWGVIAFGAILPDLFLFLRAGLRGDLGPGALEVVNVLVDAFNSAPLYALIAGLGWWSGRRWILLLATSALLHVALDLPLHAEDARAHFWPITGWTFQSPVSFWDHQHHGRVFGLLEGVLFAVCFWTIWTAVERPLAKALCLGLAVVYAVTFAHFVGHAFAGSHWAPW